MNYNLSSPVSYCISSGLLHLLPSKKTLSKLVFRYKFLLQLLFLIHSFFPSPLKSKLKEKVGLLVCILCCLYALHCDSNRLCSLGTEQVVLYNIELVESGLKVEQPKNLFLYEQFLLFLYSIVSSTQNYSV